LKRDLNTFKERRKNKNRLQKKQDIDPRKEVEKMIDIKYDA
jgi:hypothetical protein